VRTRGVCAVTVRGRWVEYGGIATHRPAHRVDVGASPHELVDCVDRAVLRRPMQGGLSVLRCGHAHSHWSVYARGMDRRGRAGGRWCMRSSVACQAARHLALRRRVRTLLKSLTPAVMLSSAANTSSH